MGIDAEMFARTHTPVTDEQIKRWRWELGASFGPENFWLWDRDISDERQYALARIDRYEQDGDDILPEPGETFLQVHPSTRYYGEGYERGDLPFLIALAQWLENKITGATVWYGGDSSGVVATPFGPAERAALWQHFVEVGHSPYRAGWGLLGQGDAYAQHRAVCGFCDVPMHRNGWGAHYAGYDCYGCGRRIESHDDGETWVDTHEVGGREIPKAERVAR